MHPNQAFAWRDEMEMLALIQQVSFSTIFFSTADGDRVAHVPVTVHTGRQIRFHLARSNRAAAGLDGAEVLLSCIGPDAYISPDWYGTPEQVPTWNYLSVECRGQVRKLDDEALLDQLDALSAEHESRLAPKQPWTRHKMSPGRIEAMMKAIACYQLEVRELRGTRKLGQNKKQAEQEGAILGLRSNFRADIAELMQASLARR